MIINFSWLFLGGSIGGVQNALNSAMDTIKFVLVIILPQAETFGWLIMASFVSVFSAAMFYTVYACKNVKKNRIWTRQKDKRQYKNSQIVSSKEVSKIITFLNTFFWPKKGLVYVIDFYNY